MVQFGKNFLPPLASENYSQQSISVKLIYQFLYLIYGFCSLDALKKYSKKKEMRIKKEMSRCCNKLVTVRSSRAQVFCKKGVLRNSQNSQENTNARVSLF